MTPTCRAHLWDTRGPSSALMTSSRFIQRGENTTDAQSRMAHHVASPLLPSPAWAWGRGSCVEDIPSRRLRRRPVAAQHTADAGG